MAKEHGPLRQMVESWIAAPRTSDSWQEDIDGYWVHVRKVTDRLDAAIRSKIESVRQRRPDDKQLSIAEACEVMLVPIRRGDIDELDAIAEFFDRIAHCSLSTMADDAWNLRNGMVPYQPGDPLYIDDDGERTPDPEPSWLERLKDVPADGRWHPCDMGSPGWQGVRHVDEGKKQTWEYDTLVIRAEAGYEQRVSAFFSTRAACQLRCDGLNEGRNFKLEARPI